MPALTSGDWYEKAPAALADGSVDFTTAPFRVALLTAAYVFDKAAHTSWADAQPAEVVGTGYTAGGALLPTTWTANWPAALGELTQTTPAEWPGADLTFRQVVVYADLGATAAEKPLIYWWTMAADQVVAGTLQFRVPYLLGLYL